MLKNVFGLLVCGFGVAWLVLSDGQVNLSASKVIGSTPESRDAAAKAALGVVAISLATGLLMTYMRAWYAKLSAFVVAILAMAFSATLTVQAVSIDYQSNDDGGDAQEERRENNEDTIKKYEKNIKLWQKQVDSKTKASEGAWEACNKHERLGNCTKLDNEIKWLNYKIEKRTDEIAALKQDNTDSKLSQDIDITDAVEEKAGIKGEWLETASIWLRAIVIPLFITLGSWGFWTCWEKLVKEYRAKKTRAA